MNTWIQYLLKRFQLIPLSLLVASDLLVVQRLTQKDSLDFILLGAIVMFYLFHNRVTDDQRDFEFDNQFHNDRAVQKGQISLRQLTILAWTSAFGILFCALLISLQAVFVVLILIAVGRWARADFNLPESFKTQYFFLYNFLNMLQMLVLQTVVYVILLGSLQFDLLIWLHILLVFVLSMHAEWTRKVFPIHQEGRDSYSDRLGFVPALKGWFVFGILVIGAATLLGYNLLGEIQLFLLVQVALFAVLILGMSFYKKFPNKSGEAIFWLSFLILYLTENVCLSLMGA